MVGLQVELLQKLFAGLLTTGRNVPLAVDLLVAENTVGRVLLLIEELLDGLETVVVEQLHFLEEEAHLVAVVLELNGNEKIFCQVLQKRLDQGPEAPTHVDIGAVWPSKHQLEAILLTVSFYDLRLEVVDVLRRRSVLGRVVVFVHLFYVSCCNCRLCLVCKLVKASQNATVRPGRTVCVRVLSVPV